jgi:5-methylcytosine-specific restriction endonuclease McrA
MNSHREDYNSPEYKAWRYAVFARDKFTCQLTGQKGCELEAHHIVKWQRSPNLRYVVSNGITLSKDAHQKLVTGREEQYEEQFKRIIAMKKMEQSIRFDKRQKKVDKGLIKGRWKWRPQNPSQRY